MTMNPFKVFVGITLVFIGLTLLAIGSISNVQYGGVVLIGPFPIVFGSSPGMAYFALIFALIMFIFLILAVRW